MTLEKDLIQTLITQAIGASKNCYAPYSKFHVGAALLDKTGKIHLGCNVENAAYGSTMCAERTAFYKAISEGVREFQAVCIVGGPLGELKDYAAPCGSCRQVMSEFCRPDEFQIILATSTEQYDVYTLKELLPLGFTPENLRK